MGTIVEALKAGGKVFHCIGFYKNEKERFNISGDRTPCDKCRHFTCNNKCSYGWTGTDSYVYIQEASGEIWQYCDNFGIASTNKC